MKQNDSKYHFLFLELDSADSYFPREERKDLLDLIKELYKENCRVLIEADKDGKYGIKYSTVHDDSTFSDTFEQFFITKDKRDKVYDDWINGRYWDKIFETELEYRTPSPNVHGIWKVFKESGSIYIEAK